MKKQIQALSTVFASLLFCSLMQAQITGVTAGTDLTGGGTKGNVTLNLNTSKVPQLAAANTFTASQTVHGNVDATGTVTGNGFNIGSNPFAFGSYASFDAFLGFAGNTTSSGTGNTATGYHALLEDTAGSLNTAYGYAAMLDNQSGSYNTAIGDVALGNNSTGEYNTAVGAWPLQYNTNGSYNTAYGAASGNYNASGSLNTFVGYYAGVSTDPLYNANAIGAYSTVSKSNAMVLGGTGSYAVSVGIGTPSPYYDYGLTVNTGGQNGNINGGVVVNATGGNLYLGMTSGTHKFRVDTNGAVYADGGFAASGADFAESVAVRGTFSQYHPGDLLEIANGAHRTLVLTQTPYSTRVAGVYSTKPGVLASPHAIDEKVDGEVPLAMVGIVPCNVTAENGSIQEGDLLVASSRPGFAMKGTDRSRMLGAVIGKALEPMTDGNGVIQVLVTLQ